MADEDVGQVGWARLDKTKFYIFAPLASLLTRLILYPTNLVKTRLQAQSTDVIYKGTWDAFRKIVRYEGVGALYKVSTCNRTLASCICMLCVCVCMCIYICKIQANFSCHRT